MALVAAIAPKSNGSSTIGMKKSVVATIACVAFRRYTAAASLVSIPTRSSLGMSPRAGLDDRGVNEARRPRDRRSREPARQRSRVAITRVLARQGARRGAELRIQGRADMPYRDRRIAWHLRQGAQEGEGILLVAQMADHDAVEPI